MRWIEKAWNSELARLLLWILAVGLAAVAVAEWSLSGPLEVGTVGEFLAGVGAFVAVGYAAIVAARDRTDRKLAEERLAEAEQEKATASKRYQASQVIFWTAPAAFSVPPEVHVRSYIGETDVEREELDKGDRYWGPDETTEAVSLFIQNRAEAPVYNCVVASGFEEPLLKFVGTLPPGTFVYEVTINAGGGSSYTRVFLRIGSGAPVRWIEFRDANGTTWRRTPDGTLQEWSEPPVNPRRFSY